MKSSHKLLLKLAGGGGYGVPQNDLFGVNLSGMEFSPVSGIAIPTQADFNYLRSKGVRYVRLAIAWENIQKTLLGALDATFQASIISVCGFAANVGIDVEVEVHNFGCYVAQAQWTTTVGYAGNAGIIAAGVNCFGDGTLTGAHLNDLLTKLATALLGKPGYKRIGIMNEPSINIKAINLATAPNALYSTYGLRPWFATSAAVITPTVDTNPLGAGYGPTVTRVSVGSGFGGVAQVYPSFTNVIHNISAYARTLSGTQPCGFGLGGVFGGGGTVTTTWTRFNGDITPPAGSGQISVSHSAGTGNDILFSDVHVKVGAGVGTYEPNNWNVIAQSAINAVRAVDATIPINVCGTVYSAASLWPRFNYELGLLTGNITPEAHQYLDGAQGVGGGGQYSGSWASYGINNNQGVDCFDDFITWCGTVSKVGQLGEHGIPSGSDQTNWMNTAATGYTALRAANMRSNMWFSGANGKLPSNNLNITGIVNDPRLLQVMGA